MPRVAVLFFTSGDISETERSGGAYTPMIYEHSCEICDQPVGGDKRYVDTFHPINPDFSAEAVEFHEVQNRVSNPACNEQCIRLLGLLDGLASKKRVLDGDLTGPAYEDALHAVWLERRACEEAARVCRNAPSAPHMTREGMCVALEEYSSAVWELES